MDTKRKQLKKNRKTNESFVMVDTSVILEDIQNINTLISDNKTHLFINDIVMKELNKFKSEEKTDRGARAREFFNSLDDKLHKRITLDKLPTSFLLNRESNSINDKYYQLVVNIKNEKIPLNIISRKNYLVEAEWLNKLDLDGLNDAKIQEICEDYNLKLITNDNSFKYLARIEGVDAASISSKKVENFDKIEFISHIEIKETDDFETEILKYVKEKKKSRNHQLVIKEIALQTNQNGGFTKYETGKVSYAVVIKPISEKLSSVIFDEKIKILDFNEEYSGMAIKPLNIEQKFYFHLLNDINNNVFAVSGATGSGKTLLALQAGVTMVKKGKVDGIVYTRNTVTATEKAAEMGFRKGSEEDKLNYFMYPLYNAINTTIEQMIAQGDNTYKLDNDGDDNIHLQEATLMYMKDFNIKVIDIAHMRGITIPKKFIIVDEMQNTTDNSMKLIGTRTGEGSKLAFLGDNNQIDHPFLSKKRNALVSLMKEAESDDFVCAIKLKETIRSETADWFDKHF